MKHDHRSWAEILQGSDGNGSLWVHDGNSKRPHVLLPSGQHSNCFLNSQLVLGDSALLGNICQGLLNQACHRQLSLVHINRVVGVTMGVISLVDRLACYITSHRRLTLALACQRSFLEPDEKNHLAFRQTFIHPREEVLLCGEVLTSPDNIRLAIKVIKKEGGHLLPYFLTLMNQTGVSEVDDLKIIALVNQLVSVWELDVCPLCRSDSKPISPYGRENWFRLTARY